MLEMLQTPTGRAVVALAATVLLFVLTIWLVPDMLPIIPAAVAVPLWLAFFPPDKPVEPRTRRLLFVTLGAGIALFLLAVFAYILAS
jgi:hypothetical protein